MQKYLETEPAAGAVLIATPTARDLKRAQMSALRNHPWAVLKTVLTGNPDQFYHDTKACRKVLFASDMSPETDKALEQISLQSEPSRVVSDLLNFKSGPPLTPCRALVITAGNDNSVSQETIAQHKAIYGAEVKNYPGKSHELIITPGWESVADDIGQWLTG